MDHPSQDLKDQSGSPTAGDQENSSATENAGDSKSDEASLQFILLVAFFVATIIGMVWVATQYVRYVNQILNISFWVTIGLSVFAVGLLAWAFVQKRAQDDFPAILVGFYSLWLCLVAGGLVYLIYAPPTAPADYESTFATLLNMDFQADNWMINALKIGFGGEDSPVDSTIEFIASQAFALPFMFLTFLAIFGIQANLAWAFIKKVPLQISIYLLAGALVTATISAIFLL
ncbi:hypothetical protein ADN00_10005 [Ornatilinea apprima]|uniref:Uncharacterized protein n=1 Tax=Ornatilinea apprima TaxID=1134406 RepID=A0A0P6Y5P3_9CHLR|nr:hypothetical protein [Ornatilinea apprima]KPL76921.1 hypothetical protein ADN00_10005 [Ornatilinea apprima]